MASLSANTRSALARGLASQAAANQVLQRLDLANLILGTGNVFYVHNTNGSDSAGGLTSDTPLKTLDAAVGKCTASNGDVIVLLPGHNEPVASATGCVIDKAGITVIGLGSGYLQPTITLGTATTATVSITAASARLVNVRVVSNIADLAVGVTLADGADYASFEGCWFGSGSLTTEMKIAVSIATTCTDVTFSGCRFTTDTSATSGSETHAIYCAGSANNLTVADCTIIGNYDTAPIDANTTQSFGISILRNVIFNIDATNGRGIYIKSDTNGVVAYNAVTGAKDNTVPLAAAACACTENYCADLAGASGIIKPDVAVFS